MSLFSLPFAASSNRKKRRATRGSSPSRSLNLRARLSVECLEDRTLMTIGTWSALNNLAPEAIGTMMLLSDGTVMGQGGGGVDFGETTHWFKLTPDETGSYQNGAWSSLASMAFTRLYYGSNVLPSGKVFVQGGEYSSAGSETRTGETYNPLTNTWTANANWPLSEFGDDPTVLLPNGKILAGYLNGPQTNLYDPATNTWTATGTKLRNDQTSEETWVPLPDGKVLSYDVWSSISLGVGHAQIYDSNTGIWSDAGTVPGPLLTSVGIGHEMGPTVLLPDGRVLQIGALAHTAIYTPSTNSWVAGPDIPGGYGADDAPAASLPDGQVIFLADKGPILGTFSPPTHMFSFDPTTDTITDITSTLPTALQTQLNSEPSYVSRMLVLPSGQLLLAPTNQDNSGNRLWILSPDGSADASWKPTISAVVDNGDGTFTVTGTQLNGISEGASYGDDAEMSSNYPIVRLTDATGSVFYARTFNWTPGITTGSSPVTVQFAPPPGIDAHSFTMTVIANGIASDARAVMPAGPSVVSQTPTNTFGPVSSIRLTFDESIDVNTFTADKIRSFTDPAGNAIAISNTDITPVAESNDTKFDVSFAAQTTLGVYTILLGPDIMDTLGHPMDQNHNGTPGEDPGDVYTGHFTINGPKIIASTDQSGMPLVSNYLPGQLTAVLLTFNEAIDPATFNRFQVIFTSPARPLFFASSVTPIAGSGNTRFAVQLAADANLTGAYTLTVVPTMQDTFGHQLDQNGNFIAGEFPGDEYVLHFNTLGPKVNSSQTVNVDTINQVYSTLRVTFNEAMALASFTQDQVQLTAPGGAVVPFNSVVPVSGTSNTQFDIVYPPQGTIGIYTVVVGPNIKDTFGNAMDQNGNLITGEIPGDQYSTTFTVNGSKITATVPIPNQVSGPEPIYALRVTFSKPMDVTSFAPAKIASFSGPGGPIGIDLISVVSGATPPNTQFDIWFRAQVLAGTYTMVIGPDIRDLSGNQMDQNGNLTPGELGVAPDGDQYAATFNIVGPMVISASPSGSVSPPVDHVRVTFNEPMAPATFTTARVAFTGPNGPIDVAAVTPVPGSNNTQFDVGFETQTVLGNYTMVIGPGITNSIGESAPPFTDYFTLSPLNNGGFETGDFTGWTIITMPTIGATIKTSTFGTGPTEGTYDALITNAGGPDHTTVESFLGLAPNALASLVSNVTNGSAIKQTVSVSAGSTLTFDWNFLTSEAMGDTIHRDFGFVSITPVGTGGTLVKLADTTSTLIGAPGASGFPRMTGFHTFTFTFTTDGTFTLGVGAMNAQDTAFASALLVDNFQIAPPSPPSPGAAPQHRSAPGAPASGVSTSVAAGPGAPLIDAVFARTAHPSFAGAGTAAAESGQLASNYNDLVFSPNQGDRWPDATSFYRGQGRPHGSDGFDPFADPIGGDRWSWI